MMHGLRRKAIYLILCISLCITLLPVGRTTAQTQSDSVWEILDHDFVYTDAFPHDIEFLNSTHGWVASQNYSSLGDGIILCTQDAGDSWQLQLANKSDTYYSIEIIDENRLWVTCRSGLVFSQDCGLSWNKTNLGGPNDYFYGIDFINQTHGWTSSNENLFKTSNAGLSWQQVDSWTFSDWARSIHFVTANNGWIIGFYGIYHTIDGGDSWERVFNRGGWSMSFVSENEAWAVSDNMLAHMVDGETWVEQEMPRVSLMTMMDPYFTDILFLDTNNGWIVGRETEVVFTPNGGRDWYSQPFPHDTRIVAVDFVNVTHGWTIGWDGYIYRTTKGNSLGSRLWTGMSDPIFLSIVGVIVVVVIVVSSSTLYWRKRRSQSSLSE